MRCANGCPRVVPAKLKWCADCNPRGLDDLLSRCRAAVLEGARYVDGPDILFGRCVVCGRVEVRTNPITFEAEWLDEDEDGIDDRPRALAGR